MVEHMDASTVFRSTKQVASLGLVVLEGARELGEKIDVYLTEWAGQTGHEGSFIIDSQCPRFSSGDGKGILRDTVRGKDLYFLMDVGNYNCKYNMFGAQNSMSPDDHFSDLKRHGRLQCYHF